MLKYIPSLTDTVIEEIPERVTLAVEISNCRGNCPGCHSPFLRDDIGEELTESAIDKLLGGNFGVNCFLFLGEGSDSAALLSLARHIKSRWPGDRSLYRRPGPAQQAQHQPAAVLSQTRHNLKILETIIWHTKDCSIRTAK